MNYFKWESERQNRKYHVHGFSQLASAVAVRVKKSSSVKYISRKVFFTFASHKEESAPSVTFFLFFVLTIFFFYFFFSSFIFF